MNNEKRSGGIAPRRHPFWATRVGMTLMEIMVVIAILGILATALAVGVFGIFSESTVQITKDQMSGPVHQALGIYKVTKSRQRRFPNAIEDANSYFEHGEVPVDAWGNEFIYECVDDCRSYRLTSYGEDGSPGGEGSNADIVSEEGRIAESGE